MLPWIILVLTLDAPGALVTIRPEPRWQSFATEHECDAVRIAQRGPHTRSVCWAKGFKPMVRVEDDLEDDKLPWQFVSLDLSRSDAVINLGMNVFGRRFATKDELITSPNWGYLMYGGLCWARGTKPLVAVEGLHGTPYQP